ncbi:MAG: DoxX family membrane protein [Elusimicrobia bacterium]|nr:DoxX family membrane protein [Elusimicrobiota bacterium]
MKAPPGSAAGRWPLSLLFCASGVGHFARAATFMKMMPPELPAHRELVLLSGAAELVCGVLLLSPVHQRRAAWGLIVLLAVVFPANLQMARVAGTAASQFPSVTPFWAYQYARPKAQAPSGPDGV